MISCGYIMFRPTYIQIFCTIGYFRSLSFVTIFVLFPVRNYEFCPLPGKKLPQSSPARTGSKLRKFFEITFKRLLISELHALCSCNVDQNFFKPRCMFGAVMT